MNKKISLIFLLLKILSLSFYFSHFMWKKKSEYNKLCFKHVLKLLLLMTRKKLLLYLHIRSPLKCRIENKVKKIVNYAAQEVFWIRKIAFIYMTLGSSHFKQLFENYSTPFIPTLLSHGWNIQAAKFLEAYVTSIVRSVQHLLLQSHTAVFKIRR